MLQGPHGPYFGMLGRALAAAGHDVHRINLNGGDRHDWPMSNGIDYRGRRSGWTVFVDDFIRRHAISDLLLFGDCRPFHAAAHRIAQLRGVDVHVFEEGYIRPDFVTLENGGVNGHSPLPSDPEWYRACAAALPPLEPSEPVAASFSRRLMESSTYTFATWINTVRFPFYRTHRPYPISVEAICWTLRYVMDRLNFDRSAEIFRRLGGTRYFVLPLQLNSDYQLRIHSPFGKMRVALRFILQSFARTAPADALLLIKRHPLDPGIVPWGRFVRRMSHALGIGDRVLYVREGDIDLMVAGACGVVTVNSTVGTLALNHRIPVSVLGGAVYKIDGIVDLRPLDVFWHDPQPPEAELYDAFRRVLIDRSLIRGGFLSDVGLELLVRNAVERLVGQDVVAPAGRAASPTESAGEADLLRHDSLGAPVARPR